MPNTHFTQSPLTPRALYSESPTRETHKEGTSSNLTNANIRATLDTSLAPILNYLALETESPVPKKEMSLNVRKCQVKRDRPLLNLSHCSTYTNFFRNSLHPRSALR